MLCDCGIVEKGLLLLCVSVKVSALFCARPKVSEVANLAVVSSTTVYAIKKRMIDCEGVNSLAGSGGKTVVDRAIRRTARLRDTILDRGIQLDREISCGMPFDNSLPPTACTSVDTFAIVYALLDRVEGCARPTRFLISLTLCPAQRSADTFTQLSL